MIKYQNDWSIRIFEHLEHIGKGLFVTLTYREKVVYRDFKNKYPYACQNMPLPPIQCCPRVIDKRTGEMYRSVFKKHIQDALKRFREYRKKKGLKNPFSYFITAEYGPRTLRPHYHGIFFGLSFSEFLPFIQDWCYRYGHVRTDIITYGKKSHFNTARYLTKYCSKGVFENPLVAQKKVLKCFKLISKGLGLSYVERMRNYHLGLSVIRPGIKDIPVRADIPLIVDRAFYKYLSYNKITDETTEFHYGLPKYYKEKLYGKKNLLRYKMYQEICRRNDDLYKQQLTQLQSERNCSFIQAVHFMELQKISDALYKEAELKERLAKLYDKSKL